MGIELNTGLATGLDIGSLISKLADAERRPINILRQRQQRFQGQIAAFGQLESRLSSLKEALGKIDGINDEEFTILSNIEEQTIFTVESSDSDTLAIISSDSTTPGTHQVEVQQLAQSSQLSHSGFASIDAPLSLSDETFVLNVGGEQHSIDITGGETTLEDLITAINELDAPVSATFIDDGGDLNPVHLIINGEETGLENAVSIAPTTTLSGFSSSDFTTAQEAQDAQIEINGITVTSSNDSFADVIEGVSFDVKKVSSDPVTITITQEIETLADRIEKEIDQDAFEGKIRGFVDSFNGVMAFINNNFGSSESRASGPLAGDRVLLTTQARLRNFLSRTDGEATLADVGIVTNQQGLLDFDSEKFAKALSENPQQIVDIFAGEGVAASMINFVEDFSDPQSGFLAVRKDGLQNSIDSLQKQVARGEQRISQRELLLRRQFTQLETVVSQLQSSQDFFLQQLASQ